MIKKFKKFINEDFNSDMRFDEDSETTGKVIEKTMVGNNCIIFVKYNDASEKGYSIVSFEFDSSMCQNVSAGDIVGIRFDKENDKIYMGFGGDELADHYYIEPISSNKIINKKVARRK